jgi:hypothetical protein
MNSPTDATTTRTWASVLLSILCAGSRLCAQPTLQITAPPNATIVSPGSTLTVTVTPSASGVFANVGVIGWDPIGIVSMPVTTSPPWQLALPVPLKAAPKRYEITAIGALVSGGMPIYSDALSIQVERADNPVSVTVDLSSINLIVGKRSHLLVWGVYADGQKYNISGSSKTTYSSNIPSVATVDAQGWVTAVSPGMATVRVANGPNAFFVTVTVPEQLRLVPRAGLLYQQQQQQFTALANYADAGQVTWSIDPPDVGTIDNTGLYTAPASIDTQQDVYILADALDGSAEAVSWVTLYPNVSVAVAPANTTMLAAQIKQFAATVSNAIDTAVDWSVSPEGGGTIDSAGVYTAPSSVSSPQQAVITATSFADPTKSASATVTINPLPPPTLTAISPANGRPGTAVNVTLTGTNFVQGATVDANNSTIIVSNVVVVSATKITATFTLSESAQGISTVTVTTSGGPSQGLPGANFTVTSDNVPSILFLKPTSGHRGVSWLDVEIYGAWFTGDMTVSVDNPGVTIEYLDILSGQVAFVGLTIAANASLGPTNLKVTTGAGTSAPAVFTVIQ